MTTVGSRLPARRLLLVPAGLALLAGLDAALLLIGAPAPVTTDRLPDVHGMLLVLGFVGTLVALERAVALGRRAGYLAPALFGAGAVLLVSPVPLEVGQALLLAGAAGLTACYVPLWRRRREVEVLVQALGALSALGAAALWLGGIAVPSLLPWLTGFVVATIAGERWELGRLENDRSGLLLPLVAATIAAAVLTLLWPSTTPLYGLLALLTAGVLGFHDVARHTIRASGQARFSAAALLAGYGWLAVAGTIWLVNGRLEEGAGYDAVVHAVFLGFTISMIMAHAPVILPGVLRVRLPYHPVLWGPPAALHLSLVLRLWLGDALGIELAWQAGGVLAVVALAAFACLAVGLVLRHRTRPAAATRGDPEPRPIGRKEVSHR